MNLSFLRRKDRVYLRLATGKVGTKLHGVKRSIIIDLPLVALLIWTHGTVTVHQ